MSGAGRSLVQRQYLRLIGLWPKDIFRPAVQMHEILSKRIDKKPADWPSDSTEAQAQSKQLNALYSLTENRYQKSAEARKTRTPGVGAGTGAMDRFSANLMRPRSNPSYYEDLMADLDAVPTRTWWQAMANRLKGMIRFSD